MQKAKKQEIYVKIDEAGKVIEKQFEKRDGYVKADESVVCGMIYDGKKFENPPIPEKLQDEEISPFDAVMMALWHMQITGVVNHPKQVDSSINAWLRAKYPNGEIPHIESGKDE